jgi:hypothetical protein
MHNLFLKLAIEFGNLIDREVLLIHKLFLKYYKKDGTKLLFYLIDTLSVFK